MKIFVICPVRNADPVQTERIATYVVQQGSLGHTVYWPARDTNQEGTGLAICRQNLAAMSAADEVHIYFDPNSQGSVFDLGAAMALGKRIVMINREDFQKTPGKSFQNVVIDLNAERAE